MPIYEYQCEDCGHQLEIIQKISDSPLVDCPACGNSSLKKRVSAAAFHLKGAGWYVTDFKEKPKSKETTDKDSKKETDTGKSETKKQEPASTGTDNKTASSSSTE